MSGRVGLYEFLSVGVASPTSCESAVGGTVLTHSSHETYDDDPELGSMVMWSESTVETRTNSETYDDDPGIDGLRDLSDLGTDRTATPNETYDDNSGLELLGVPGEQLETTVVTKVVGETHDDDGVSLLLDA